MIVVTTLCTQCSEMTSKGSIAQQSVNRLPHALRHAFTLCTSQPLVYFTTS